MMLVSFASALSWEEKNNQKFESFEVYLTTNIHDVSVEYIPSMEKPNKIVMSWNEDMPTYNIVVGGTSYFLGTDFDYFGKAVYTVWRPTGELHPILGVPLGEIMELKVNYMYDFRDYGGIDGTINMYADIRMTDWTDFFTGQTMHITSLSCTGDLQNVNIKATNGGTGNPSHIGTVIGWPE
jgi:hypothetical protein